MKGKQNRQIIPALFAAAILVVAMNTWWALHSLGELLDSERWVQHTWQVVSSMEQINASTRDAESSARGFFNSGREGVLEPFYGASAALPRQMDTFRRLTGDNRSQQRRIDQLQAMLVQRLAQLNRNIALRRSNQLEQLQAILDGGEGNALSMRIRALSDEIEQEEQGLLAVREADAHEDGRQARWSILLASGMDFLLLLLMGRYFVRESTLRAESEAAAEHLAVAHAESETRAAEIQQLNMTLEERVRQRTAELETTNRELEAFSYSVSHDLRAPLRTIDGFSLALEEDYAEAVDDMGRDYIRRVRNGVQRMGQLIDALLQLSRITRSELVRGPVDVSALVQNVVADLQRASHWEGHDVDFHVESGMRAEADGKLLQVAFENLLSNAVKFSGKVEHPVIEVGWDAAQHAFFIRDNGAGFDMYYADKLFNAFNRLHGDKDFKGSGIGLATVARVVRRHHGRIWADSKVGHGATFWFTLG